MCCLQNTLYFPTFDMLPQADDLGGSYYQETQQGESSQLFCSYRINSSKLCCLPRHPFTCLGIMSGLVMPARTWAFVGEIVTDSLSQLAVLGHRVEVSDSKTDREQNGR